MQRTLTASASAALVALLGQPAWADVVRLRCAAGAQAYAVIVDPSAQTIKIPEAMGEGVMAPAQITEEYYTVSFRNIYGVNETRRIDRTTGVLYYLVNGRWDPVYGDGLVCTKAGGV